MAITVTAAESGTTFHGVLLRVQVLTGATLAGTPATAVQSATGAHQASITTTQTGSLVYGAVASVGTGSFTASAGSTMVDNQIDSSNGARWGTTRTTSVTGTPGAVTSGASAPSTAGGCALLEVIPAGTIAEDASAPAPAFTSATTTVTTGSFTPPAGALLVAMVSADTSTATVLTVSDSSGLAWTQRVVAQTTGDLYAGVWTAQVPGAVPPPAIPPQPAPAWPPDLPGLPSGEPFQPSPYGIYWPPPLPDLYPATYTDLYGGPEAPQSSSAFSPALPAWVPNLPGLPGGAPFTPWPVTGPYTLPAAAAVTAPPGVLTGPVRARGGPPGGGRIIRRAGAYAGTGPQLRAPEGPLRAQPAPRRGGSVQSRSGTFTFVSLTSGPPVYPLHGPVEARGLPQRGGHTAGRSGTFTFVSLTSGPPVYPQGHPAQARRLAQRGGAVSHRAGTYAGSGPAVPALKQPLGLCRQQPPPPVRGRVMSAHGLPQPSGPPVPPLHRAIRAQPQAPVLYGRADGRAGIAVFVPPPPFTIGSLTAATSPGAASGGTLTASDTRTGGPGG